MFTVMKVQQFSGHKSIFLNHTGPKNVPDLFLC